MARRGASSLLRHRRRGCTTQRDAERTEAEAVGTVSSTRGAGRAGVRPSAEINHRRLLVKESSAARIRVARMRRRGSACRVTSRSGALRSGTALPCGASRPSAEAISRARRGQPITRWYRSTPRYPSARRPTTHAVRGPGDAVPRRGRLCRDGCTSRPGTGGLREALSPAARSDRHGPRFDWTAGDSRGPIPKSYGPRRRPGELCRRTEVTPGRGRPAR